MMTPNSNRLHIALFGRRNSGKSSLINALTGQDVALVSDTPGTTTDPVLKAMEIQGVGPCLFIDTPGYDDEGELGEMRMTRTLKAAEKTDIALLLCHPDMDKELQWIQRLKEKNIPVILLLNKADILEDAASIASAIKNKTGESPLIVSANTRQGMEDIRRAIIRRLPEDFDAQSITGKLVSAGDLVLLVMPQDIQAPKGRLILPQAQTLRELLDKKCIAVSCTTDQMEVTLQALSRPPKLIITDSQVFKTVYERKPAESKLTSFSVLFAAYKGDIGYYTASAATIGTLKETSRVLIAEACTHAPLSEDIGRVKLPRMLRQKIGEGLQIDIVSGNDFPANPEKYEVFKERNGLENSQVRAITEDKLHQIWISTNGGVSRLDEAKKVFYNYSHHDGVPMGDFMNGSTCMTSDGTMYFGSQNGACYFNPKDIPTNREVSSIVITRFCTYHRMKESHDEELPMPIADGEINLPYNQNTFKISFNVLDYTQSPQVEFTYMLEGLEKAWYNTQGENQVTFRNISPGTYVFKVKTRIRNQEWDEKEASLVIHIQPPFWLTWYAKLVYVLLFVLALYGLLNFYKHKIDLESSLDLERRKSQNDLELNNERLRFYTNITHELRTPLTLILGPLEDLLSDGTLSPKHANKISIIHDSATRLLNLINRILEFRKTETQNRKLAVAKGNLAQLVQEIGLRYKELNPNNKVTYHIHIETEDAELFYDADMVTIILDNLLSNAVKYTSEGEITLTLRSVEEMQIKYTEISVKDTGHGIEPEALPHIFDRYYQAKSKFQASGSGIGLALVKGLTDLHEGMLKVESTPEVGTTFILRLLTENTYPNAIHVESKVKKLPIPTEDMGGMDPALDGCPIVLVVEDNSDIREYIKSSFADIYEVITAKDGQEGWELTQARIPNVIVSDIMMPIMDGVELCKKVKEDMRTSHIPVILLTAKDSLHDKEEGYASGADAYLTKPFSAKLLHSCINNLLETRKKIASQLLLADVKPAQEQAVSSLNRLDNEFMQKITQIIEENIEMEKMDVAFIADKMCMSHSTLYRKIKGLADMSANEFIRKVKMRKSVEMLISGEYTISEISYMTGFSSVAYFRQCFKNEYGVSPSGYVKQKQ